MYQELSLLIFLNHESHLEQKSKFLNQERSKSLKIQTSHTFGNWALSIWHCKKNYMSSVALC